ncbi:hypothetical protein AB1Y20_012869 [Prymnesium parvum]|uniref:NAD-dependent epimerase/dehydratase domain-containing protein n=1 Tax=Prymnesium parvum TaxID=97485 RepID=A0AB34IJV8_PRYPA
MLLFLSLPAAWHAMSPPSSRFSLASARMSAESTLIIQNKGGGHGEIGYHLALQLAAQGHDVTILHEGPNKGKPPHSSYADLSAAGVRLHWRDSLEDAEAAIAQLGDAAYGAVVDNWSKSPEQISPYARLAQQRGAKSYAYVSSAGMYAPPSDAIIGETCDCKPTAQRQAELLLDEMGLPFTYFRPQYIYGPKQGKSYLAYFFDRITRGRPVLVPNGGDQLVTMTHAADNAAMIAAAIGNPKAVGEAFNCATSSLCTYDQLVQSCAAAAGKEAQIVHYNPKDFDSGISKKLGFPFRDTAFYVSVEKATNLLGFQPKHNILEDLAWYYADNYVAKGAEGKELDFSVDDLVLKGTA